MKNISFSKNIVSSKGGRKSVPHCSSKMRKTTKKIDDVSTLLKSLENCARNLKRFLKVVGRILYYLIRMISLIRSLFDFPSAL